MAEPRYYAWNELWPNDANVVVVAEEADCLRMMRQQHSVYQTMPDERVLVDFLSVHWAWPCEMPKQLGPVGSV